ncbi:MAG: phosphoadenylyl-sulfate reductase [Candidatus Latescibacterota bacterium]
MYAKGHGPLEYGGSSEAREVLAWTLLTFGNKAALACSFSPEDIVVIHMMRAIREDARVFAIDTGRLNEETYVCADEITGLMGGTIEWFFPKRQEVEALERAHGLHSFRNSLEARHECCGIRKVEPLSRALSGLRAWITGMRREQSVTRKTVAQVAPDDAHKGLLKINPLIHWSSDEVWEYIRENKLPYNRLHDQGYPSIGCEPCTRATAPGEHERAGRWWWEHPEHKECGLHIRPECGHA